MVLKKIRNLFPLNNDKYQVSDRLLTFEGPDHVVKVGT